MWSCFTRVRHEKIWKGYDMAPLNQRKKWGCQSCNAAVDDCHLRLISWTPAFVESLRVLLPPRNHPRALIPHPWWEDSLQVAHRHESEAWVMVCLPALAVWWTCDLSREVICYVPIVLITCTSFLERKKKKIIIDFFFMKICFFLWFTLGVEDLQPHRTGK